jgi:hypothetical protein
MKVSNDHSLFAWKGKIIGNRRKYLYTGLLANSPNCFVDSGNIAPTRKEHNSIPFATTNLGLRIELVLVPRKFHNGLSIAVLDCIDSRDNGGPLGIQVERFQFIRISSDTLFIVTRENSLLEGITLYSQVLYVRQLWEAKIVPPPYRTQLFRSRTLYSRLDPRPPPCYVSLSPSNQSS